MIHFLRMSLVLTLFLGAINTLYGYHKFCYTSRNYTGSHYYLDYESIAKSKKKVEHGRAIHAFTYSHAGNHYVVRLSRRDLRRVRNLLADYDKATLIDKSFIKKFLETHKKRHAVVGWILQDFNRVKPGMTVGTMLTTLKLS